MTGLFLGVDGGGSKTAFVCIDRSGIVRARSVTATTYHLEAGFDGAVARLAEGIEAICSAMSCTPADLDYSFFGLPAFGEDAAIDPRLEAACGKILGTDRYRCGNDMICGWAGSLECRDGINIVAGTGSIAYGERGGRGARAGGWGEIFGDEGSGYWISVQALSAFSRMSDGRLERGALHSLIGERLGLASDLDLCARVNGPDGLPRSAIAAIAPCVPAAADAGDAVALAILQNAGLHLAELGLALRKTLAFGPDERTLLSWSGSILTEIDHVRAAFVDALERAGGFRFVEPRHPPALGAAIYARKLAGSSTSTLGNAK